MEIKKPLPKETAEETPKNEDSLEKKSQVSASEYLVLITVILKM